MFKQMLQIPTGHLRDTAQQDGRHDLHEDHSTGGAGQQWGFHGQRAQESPAAAQEVMGCLGPTISSNQRRSTSVPQGKSTRFPQRTNEM